MSSSNSGQNQANLQQGLPQQPAPSPPVERLLTVPQAINILYQAVQLGQKAGVYTFNDSYMIKFSLDSLRMRLGLNENMQPQHLANAQQNRKLDAAPQQTTTSSSVQQPQQMLQPPAPSTPSRPSNLPQHMASMPPPGRQPTLSPMQRIQPSPAKVLQPPNITLAQSNPQPPQQVPSVVPVQDLPENSS